MSRGRPTVATARIDAAGVLDRPELQQLLAVLNHDGEEAKVVGGAVRNALLGLPPGDIDIATTAPPEETTRRAEAAGFRAAPTGIEHGTVTVVVAHHPFEVTTLREDVKTDGRRAVVAFGRDFARDAERRDFTINALYAAADGTVFDYVGGLQDLAARRVRFIGSADTRIREDYLRILRLFRFHSEYGEGPLDHEALSASIALRGGLAQLSHERVRTELLKLLVSRRASETLETVADCGFLDRLLGLVPDVCAFRAMAPRDPILRLAALALRVREDAALLAERLRLSNGEATRLLKAAALLETLHGSGAPETTHDWRVLAYRHGAPALGDAVAIEAARGGDPLWLATARKVLAQPAPRFPWSGRDVLALGLAPGRAVGAALARAEALWIAGDFPSDDETLSAILTNATSQA